MTLSMFSSAARSWFEASFGDPTAAQREGWPPIADGRNTLLLAPTGSGKTLAAFLWAIDRMATEPAPERERRTRVLYISPLRTAITPTSSERHCARSQWTSRRTFAPP